MPRPVAVLALNRIQRVLEQEGLEAITPERIEGWKEIAEGYLLPLHDASIPTGASSETSPR
jgi:hypothetical protein